MTTFTILQEHLDLLAAAYWRWNDCEFGGPEVDPKRPFGNSSGEYRDMAEAVGWQYNEDDQEQEDGLMRLYRETLTVLVVGFSAGIFEPGEYERGGDGWQRVADDIR